MPELVIPARTAMLSEGMAVKRILPFRSRRMVGPFIFMDHAGPLALSTSSSHNLDVLPHPHIGLSTVTYLFGGQVTHRDSLGVEQIILPGEVNWMTAGSGISHSERFETPAAVANAIEMLQTWVALPVEEEERLPSFDNFKIEQLPVFNDPGVWYRLIAGSAFGLESPVKTLSPLVYMHIELASGKSFEAPENYSERGLYIVKGEVECGAHRYRAGELLIFSKNEKARATALCPTTLLLLGGEPLGMRHIWWNFVSSRKERIEQAKADWLSGRIQLPPHDNLEFVPLPPDRSSGNTPAPGALS